MHARRIADWGEVVDREPYGAKVSGIELVIVRFDDNASVFYGRCLHRGALMADGYVSGDDILCSVHNWDYCYRTGVSSYANEERLHRFTS